MVAILHGEETRDAATHWWVFHAMSPTRHPPLFETIELEVDVPARTAHARVPGLLESRGRPILSPVDGSPHRIRIDLPHGMEFEIAEIGSASTTASTTISQVFTDTYGQFNTFRITGNGFDHGSS